MIWGVLCLQGRCCCGVGADDNLGMRMFMWDHRNCANGEVVSCPSRWSLYLSLAFCFDQYRGTGTAMYHVVGEPYYPSFLLIIVSFFSCGWFSPKRVLVSWRPSWLLIHPLWLAAHRTHCLEGNYEKMSLCVKITWLPSQTTVSVKIPLMSS